MAELSLIFLSIFLPAVSAHVVIRRLNWVLAPARWLAGLVLSVALFLLPVQAVAVLQLLHITAKLTFVQIAAAQAFVFAAAWGYAHLVEPPQSRSLAGVPVPRYILLGGVLIVACYSIFFVDALSSYPDGWDAVGYHLPVALEWLQTKSLALPVSKDWHFSLPGNSEIGTMTLLATGHQSLVCLTNLVALVMLALAVYLIAYRITSNQNASLVSVVVVLSMPILNFQASTAYVDLFGTANILAATALFLWRNGDRDFAPSSSRRQFLWTLGLAGLACGIALGTKPVFYVYGGVFLAAVLLTLILENREGPRSRLRLCCFVLILSLLPFSFWLGRAYLATGNPIYPLRLQVGKSAARPGYSAAGTPWFTIQAPNDLTQTEADYDERFVRSRAEWMIYPWTEWKRFTGYLLIPYSVETGTGGAFAAFVPLGLIFAIVSSRRHGSGRTLLLFVAMLLFLVLMWWVGLRRMPRFGLPIWVGACILSAPLFEGFMQQRRRLFPALLLVSIALTCLVSAFTPLHSLAGRIKSGDWTRAGYYEIPSAIDELSDGGSVLNLKATHNNFGFAGRRLSHAVITDFEAPDTLSAQFITQRNIAYIVERGPFQKALSVPEVHLQLVYDESQSVRLKGEPWRIWKVAGTDYVFPEKQSRLTQ